MAVASSRDISPPVVGQPLGQSPIAHAELNALAGVSRERLTGVRRLLSTLTPCPMCLHAAGVAGVTEIQYAGIDPGAMAAFPQTGYGGRPLPRMSQVGDEIEVLFFELLPLVGSLRLRGTQGSAFQWYRERRDPMAWLGVELAGDSAFGAGGEWATECEQLATRLGGIGQLRMAATGPTTPHA